MSRLEKWVAEYSDSHQNKINQRIHKICVPVIAASTVGLLNEFSLRFIREDFKLGQWLLFAALLYYASFGLKVFVQMCFAGFLLLLALVFCQYFFPVVWPIYLGLFLLAWGAQFVGHKIEGKNPSFLQDLRFLMIGPLWAFHKKPKK